MPNIAAVANRRYVVLFSEVSQCAVASRRYVVGMASNAAVANRRYIIKN